MTWLAAQTKNIHIGSLVLCSLYRHPALLAKMATTLDIFSNGRLELGLGSCGAMNKFEAKPRGMKWPTISKRLEILEETIQICKELWTREKVSFNGKHFQLKDTVCEPKPIQKPHPPILVAGWGEKITLRLVAKYADKNNFGLIPLDIIGQRLEVLKDHCLDVGRDFDSIEKTAEIGVIVHSDRDLYLDDMRERFRVNVGVGSFEEWLSGAEDFWVVGTPEDCVEKLQRYIDLGIGHFMIRFGDLPNLNGVKLFAKKVIPKLNP
jgi:alkanesulfonate monooxygenase SsuD/methylene tetrahydromethanopterin reductase-like flavin-dependent oxidoreductase (luciferase family)